MSLTETHTQVLSGYTLCTADSRSVVKVAIPHLRGKWSPTNAILCIFVVRSIGNALDDMPELLGRTGCQCAKKRRREGGRLDRGSLENATRGRLFLYLTSRQCSGDGVAGCKGTEPSS